MRLEPSPQLGERTRVRGATKNWVGGTGCSNGNGKFYPRHYRHEVAVGLGDRCQGWWFPQPGLALPGEWIPTIHAEMTGESFWLHNKVVNNPCQNGMANRYEKI